MRIHVLAVGNRMPPWIDAGFREYARRIPPHCALRLTEIPVAKRSKNLGAEVPMRQEGQRLLALVPTGAWAIALERSGKQWDSEQLATALGEWMQDGTDVALLIGGPDGLAPECLARAARKWSLSALTLPHGLVRVIVAEQIYRAWSLLARHPYHR